MRTLDALALAFANLKRTKFRSFLTISGVVIGIGSIILLVSLGIGLEKITTSQIAGMDSLLTITVTQKQETSSMALGAKIDEQTAAKIAKIDNVKSVSPVINLPAVVTIDGTSSQAFTVGIKKEFLPVEVSQYSFGGGFGGEDDMVITKVLAEMITSNPSELIGQNVSVKASFVATNSGEDPIQEITGKISGISSDSTGNFIYMPIDLIKDGATPPEYSTLKVKVNNRGDIDGATSEIKKMGYEVTTVKELIDQVSKIFLIVQIVLAFFGAIGLLVATLGIINTMTISLTERIREIGIMKALGASNGDIRKLFLFESALIGFFGGLIGIASAYLVSALLNALICILMKNAGQAEMNVFVFSWLFSAIMVGFSILVSLFAGIYPALRAQKMEPLKALFQR